MQFSYWEKKEFNSNDSTVVLGAGIVGLSTAISLKEARPDSSVIVIDRSWPPKGASTKNAGFLCYGSPSEILSDLESDSQSDVLELIKLRWEGAGILRKRIGNIAQISGGYELYQSSKSPSTSDYNVLNELLYEATGGKNHFIQLRNESFSRFDKWMTSMPNEGMIDPMQAMEQLKYMATTLGIKFMLGINIASIDHSNKHLTSSLGTKIGYEKCIVCTNGFTKHLLIDHDVHPVRNMVMVTSPIKNHNLRGVYHFDEGFVYFRNINDRVLIGGARNIAFNEEKTDQFGINTKIRLHLEQFLSENVLPGMNYTIESLWSGILGVSTDKFPIIKDLDNDLYIGVKMGGMGVAIGSIIGQKIANLIYE